MRLIDAEPIIKDMISMKAQLGYDAISIDGIVKALKEADKVDAVPVVHGMWVPESDGYWHCSQCGRKVYSSMFSPSFIHHKDDKQYCPSCGAKMDLQAEQKEEAQNEP